MINNSQIIIYQNESGMEDLEILTSVRFSVEVNL